MVSPESQYVLDGMVSLLHTTADIANAPITYGWPYDQFIDAWDAQRAQRRPFFRDHYYHADKTRELYLHWYNEKATAAQRAYSSLYGLKEFSFQWNEFTLTLGHKIVATFLSHQINAEGNYYQTTDEHDHLIIQKLSPTHLRHIEDLTDVEKIGSAVENANGLARWWTQAQELIARARNALDAVDEGEVQAFHERLTESRVNLANQCIRDFVGDYEIVERPVDYEEAMNRAVAKCNIFDERLQGQTPWEKSRLLPWWTKDKRKRAKKILVRSFETMKSLLGESTTKAFLNGERITFEGQMFRYVVKRSQEMLLYNSFGQHHIPYKLLIETHDGVVLAEGCVVFEDSPILDQVIALYLSVKHHERELLKKTNWFNKHADFDSHPVFVEIAREKAEALKAARAKKRAEIAERDGVDVSTIHSLIDVALGDDEEQPVWYEERRSLLRISHFDQDVRALWEIYEEPMKLAMKDAFPTRMASIDNLISGFGETHVSIIPKLQYFKEAISEPQMLLATGT